MSDVAAKLTDTPPPSAGRFANSPGCASSSLPSSAWPPSPPTILNHWYNDATAILYVTNHLFADLFGLAAGMGSLLIMRRWMFRAGARIQMIALTALLLLMPLSAAVGYVGWRVVEFVGVMHLARWQLPARGGLWIEHATNLAQLLVMIAVLHRLNQTIGASFAAADTDGSL